MASCSGMSADKELQSYFEHYSGAAAEVSRMERIINSMQKGEMTEEVLQACPELATAYKQQEKLKYRKIILERSLAEQIASNQAKGIATTGTAKPAKDAAAGKSKGAEKKDKAAN
ncbi:unnamed protein product, partial [Nippostrongylus brasiliensis]|uniref:Lipoprotein n=1 Tax=Nippostrongylus brasiliensis TaxID=27835 RepID=A0A0N4YHN2_NIPBR